MNLNKHIVLIGSSGAGKSDTAKEVEKRFGVPRYDTDDRVVEASGMEIPKIFAEYGEPEFRKREAAALLGILGEKPGITATGGGIVGSEVGLAAVTGADASIVWLQVDLDTAWDRVHNDPNRPLAGNRDVFEARFNARSGLWESCAGFAINAELPVVENLPFFAQFFNK